MQKFQQSKWIWINHETEKDVYGEFVATFSASVKPTICRLSCDGDYTLFVNGKYVSSNQYGDFEHYKIYDEIDIAPYLKEGENTVRALVWHFGEDSQRHLTAQAGLLFEITQDEKILAASGENTLCRKSPVYKNGYQKKVTYQLGYSFFYDARKETEEGGWSPAVVVEKQCNLFPRPNQKSVVGERVKATILKNEGNYFLIDLGQETVGLADLEFFSATEQKLLVCWGEDLQNGHVRRIIANRDFSFEYMAKKGENKYANYMLRLGCRYLEVYAEQPIEISYVGLLPQSYPVKTKKFRLKDSLDQKIYDLCENSLKLCLMEHYVDTPWREQCLYAFDSRNQMLCGYYAFEDGNAEYARSNLKLMSEDRRDDGLLSICSPCGMDLTIPSFSLYFFMAVKEYVEHTGDVAFAAEIYPKLTSILDTFIRNRKDGLLYKFAGGNHWNFYDWSPYMDGSLVGAADGTPQGGEGVAPDLMINALFITALENLKWLDERIGNTFAYQAILDETRNKTREAFFCKESGLFAMTSGGKEYTALGNAFAILAGLTDKTESEGICEALVDGRLIDCSLSMKTFKYDALLQTDKAKWQGQVFDEIRKEYKKMLDEGATATWETIEGAAAFDDAGSLCHGWSAIPVYYYQKYSV